MVPIAVIGLEETVSNDVILSRCLQDTNGATCGTPDFKTRQFQGGFSIVDKKVATGADYKASLRHSPLKFKCPGDSDYIITWFRDAKGAQDKLLARPNGQRDFVLQLIPR